jgi:hypothetical protein
MLALLLLRTVCKFIHTARQVACSEQRLGCGVSVECADVVNVNQYAGHKYGTSLCSDTASFQKTKH